MKSQKINSSDKTVVGCHPKATRSSDKVQTVGETDENDKSEHKGTKKRGPYNKYPDSTKDQFFDLLSQGVSAHRAAKELDIKLNTAYGWKNSWLSAQSTDTQSSTSTKQGTKAGTSTSKPDTQSSTSTSKATKTRKPLDSEHDSRCRTNELLTTLEDLCEKFASQKLEPSK